MLAALLSLSATLAARAATPTYSATYLPSNIPAQTEEGQAGTNQCGTGFNQTSMCQNAYLNSLEDWCVWAPPEPGPTSDIGDTERFEVAWCLKNGTGARLIPDGAITGAHWIITPDYVQLTGTGNLSMLNIPTGDPGGELDPHGADGNGNPIGGVVFSNAFGQLEEIFEWTNFMGDGLFCFRACNPSGSNPKAYCQHVYDVMGCDWNMPGQYSAGFDSCSADSGEPMGVYGTSTFHQGDAVTPDPHPAPSSSSCATVSTLGNGFIIQGTSISPPTSTPTTQSGASISGSSATATTSGNAGRSVSTSVQGWERLVVSVGSAIVFSLLGAALVL
ncbi:hypothetical protein C8F01DRAFT_1116102 [Mycena amicta]|nr:hypothetical protein C8F01DRAFT_1116102 [Mycena amicta]